MIRLEFAFFASSVLCFSMAIADEKPKLGDDEKVGVELKKAKEQYQSVSEKAGEKLFAAFTEQQEKLEENTKLKVDQQLKLIEQLKLERKAFEADPAKLPKSPSMQVAVSDYRTSTTTAGKKCETAFDKAAKKYRDLKDIVSAKAVLDEKATFLGILSPGKFNLTIEPGADEKNPLTLEFLPNGTFIATNNYTGPLNGTWMQKGRLLELVYATKTFGTSTLRVKNIDELYGENIHTNGKSIKWSLTRVK